MLDFDPDLMAPGAYNLEGTSMESLPSELDDLLSLWPDHDASVDASVNAPSRYHTTPGSSQAPTLTVPTVYSASSAGDLTGQGQHKPHQDEPRVNFTRPQTDSLLFFGSIFSNPPLPSDLSPSDLPVNLNSSHDVDAAQPTVQDPSVEEKISPSSAPVRPESDFQRITTSDNVDVSSQGAQSTASDDHLRDVDNLRDEVRRVLGQSPTRQRLSQVRQGLGGLCTDLDKLLDAQQSEDGMQMAPPPRQPSANKSKTKHHSQSRVKYRCIKCGVRAATKDSFKRHVESKHHPRYDYHCHIDSCKETVENPPHRRDKLLRHYTSAHDLDAPPENIIKRNRASHLCPLRCALCRRTVQNWKDFYGCFVKHCEIKLAPPKASAHRDSHGHRKKRHRDGPDKGNFGSGADDAGFLSQVGYRHSEEVSGASNPRPSGSGDNQQGRSKQQGGSSQQSSQPQLDLPHLQDQTTPRGSRNQCKFCHHVFDTCSYCCDSPSSTPWCHACPDSQRAFAMQAGDHHAGQARGHLSQPMEVADHFWADQQALNDVSSRIPTVVAVNPSLYGAIPQGAQQLNIHLLQHAQAHGRLSGTVTQQGLFESDQFWTVRALHDVQVAGMSELKIEHSISDSKKKKAQSSNIWSDSLPPQSGPVSLNNVSFSSMCHCPCRMRSQGAYFTRTRVEIAPGRMIEMDFKMGPEARGLGHPLRTRIQVVVKMLRLRFSVAKPMTAKNQQEAHSVLKEALEAPLNCSESKAINCGESVKVADPNHIDYESDAESVADSIFSMRSRVSSWNDVTMFSPRPSSPALSSSGILKLSAPARSSSPPCRDSDDTNDDEQLLKVVEPFEEEKDLELTFDLDLLSSLNMLVPGGNLSSGLSVQDPDRIFEFFMRYMLFVIFSLAHARDCDPTPYLTKRRPPQS
ncbi:uncharacterized protein N7496_011250 [Penicillium cataractarum]|uniref:C2H2-type domain-containing protein n=1 Tax=Penicillium cataractarum TaxID=2100454 RepID=A0A9W9REM7_9EURO|nr:uncharacterized protein N7496_011250 [Penicillium cataractarum]KAJ5358837.1 hypothetical protein N7496_011250 [Penicillium cataractarum]